MKWDWKSAKRGKNARKSTDPNIWRNFITVFLSTSVWESHGGPRYLRWKICPMKRFSTSFPLSQTKFVEYSQHYPAASCGPYFQGWGGVSIPANNSIRATYWMGYSRLADHQVWIVWSTTPSARRHFYDVRFPRTAATWPIWGQFRIVKL